MNGDDRHERDATEQSVLAARERDSPALPCEGERRESGGGGGGGGGAVC